MTMVACIKLTCNEVSKQGRSFISKLESPNELPKALLLVGDKTPKFLPGKNYFITIEEAIV